jgi:hypothetical protein
VFVASQEEQLCASYSEPTETVVSFGEGVEEGTEMDYYPVHGALQYNYVDRLREVASWCDTEVVVTSMAKGRWEALSNTEVEEHVKMPASDGFVEEFDGFTDELRASEGSRRARAKKEPYKIGSMPPRFKPNPKYYDVADPAWAATAPPVNGGIKGSELLKGSSLVPYIRVEQTEMSTYETMNREAVSVLSYGDWFFRGADRMAGSIKDRCEFYPTDHLSEEARFQVQEFLSEVVKDANCVQDMLESGAQAVYDARNLAASQACLQLMSRRDCWLRHMDSKGMEEEIEALRFSDVKGPKLFEDDLLKLANDKMRALTTTRLS